ncbi:MAG: PEP-CTERM sorting domain-containing protein [Opitutales bacterium]
MKALTSLFALSLTAAASLNAQFASSPFTENFNGSGAVFNPAFWGPQVTLRGNGGTLSQGSGVLNWQAGAPTGDSNSQALPSVCFVPFNVAFTVNATVTIPDSTVFQNISAGGDVALGIGVFSGRELLTQPGFNPANPTISTLQNNIGIEGLVFNPDGGGVATNSIRVQSDVSAAGADPLDENGEVIDEPGDIIFAGTSATIGIQISWDPIEAVMTTAITGGGNEGSVIQFLNLPEAWGDGTLGDFGTNPETDLFGLNVAGFASDEVSDGEIVMEIFTAETLGGNFFVHVPEPTTVSALFGLLALAGAFVRRRLR